MDQTSDEFIATMIEETGATGPWAGFNVTLAAGVIREAAAMTTPIAGGGAGAHLSSRGQACELHRLLSGRTDHRPFGWAVLDKSAGERDPPFPGHTFPAATVTGIPGTVKRLRTATRV